MCRGAAGTSRPARRPAIQSSTRPAWPAHTALWLVDGQFKVEFTPTYEKTITMRHGTTHHVCTDVD
ncbi:hypothetical protein [Micromonospora coerulea]|uniref:hypothetical protein n=1 Tax=Micromonospora coerulea TaxID=47856 RepID=UPI001905CF32|nr:hypothetical protein [Micromonospora veneta]